MTARHLAAIAFLIGLALPRAAAADSRALDARIDAVHVANEADGSLVAVKLSGRHRPRILRSVERLVTIVLADVDADGDVDILATTIRQGLLVWRNSGRGRFILARLPKARDGLGSGPRVSSHAPGSKHNEPSEANPDFALAPAAGLCDPLVVQSPVVSVSFSSFDHFPVIPTGRAPPSLN